MKEIMNSLGQCDKGKYINPCEDMYWLFNGIYFFIHKYIPVILSGLYLKPALS